MVVLPSRWIKMTVVSPSMIRLPVVSTAMLVKTSRSGGTISRTSPFIGETLPSGLRMWIRIAPPTRAAISHTGLVKPLGPHHRASRSASVHARNTVARGASNTRVMVTSRSVSVLSRAATAMIYLQASPVKLLRHQNHPMHAELVGKHAEARREECLGERHRDLAALRQRRELLIGVRLIFGDDR